MSTCPSCGSERLEPGALQSAALTMDRVSTMKKVFNTGGLVRCLACLDCGAIFDLRADPKHLAEMLS